MYREREREREGWSDVIVLYWISSCKNSELCFTRVPHCLLLLMCPSRRDVESIHNVTEKDGRLPLNPSRELTHLRADGRTIWRRRESLELTDQITKIIAQRPAHHLRLPAWISTTLNELVAFTFLKVCLQQVDRQCHLFFELYGFAPRTRRFVLRLPSRGGHGGGT